MEILSELEIRVLGALIEKEITTPEYYPLTLNALKNACNQKSNRNPVVTFDDKTILKTLDSLNSKKLAMQFSRIEFRVPKYKHTFVDLYRFSPDKVALFCVLFLRGPQTIGELRNRTSRLYEFDNLSEVEKVLEILNTTQDGPFVKILPRIPGQKEARYTHLFCGEPEIDSESQILPIEKARLKLQTEDERIVKLEDDISLLKVELKKLQDHFLEFKGQFE